MMKKCFKRAKSIGFQDIWPKTRREIKEKISLVDLVYEVIDARMPISSRVVDLDELIANKHRIIIMTKYDKCDKYETDKIIDFYRNQGIVVVPVDLINNKNINNIFLETSKISEKLNNQRIEKGMKKRNIRVLVVGSPNVGKSTLINKLVGKKAVQTGDKPGVTKQLGWIRIGKDIELLDSPGILWPKLDNQVHAHNLSAFSSIKEEILDLEDLSIYIIETLKELYPKLLMKRYSMDKLSDDIVEIFDSIGKKRGALKKHSDIDYEKVYKIIIQDLKNGNFGEVTFDRL